jgi:hypothetical protein
MYIGFVANGTILGPPKLMEKLEKIEPSPSIYTQEKINITFTVFFQTKCYIF